MKKCICISMSWGISYWPSSTLGTSTNHMLMSHEKMHLPFHVMGKCMGNFSLMIKLAIFPFSHLNQSMSFHITKKCICLFISWEKSRTIFHWSSYLAFHYEPSNYPFTSQSWTLKWMTFEFTLGSISHILWTLKRVFGKLYLLEPWDDPIWV